MDNLRIMYVKYSRIAHMVLAYHPKPKSVRDDPLILDNMSTRVLKLSVRKDLTPAFSFNQEGLWLVKRFRSGVNDRMFYKFPRQEDQNPKERLKKWRDLLIRVSQGK